jgi:thiol-disulfide isomerase/thioredoxin
MTLNRTAIAFVVVVCVCGTAIAFAAARSSGTTRLVTAGVGASGAVSPTLALDPPTQRPNAPELVAPQGFLNGQAFTMASLRGKVVLVDFWTFDCINCQRTLPFLRTWYGRYRQQGFEIVGVHTPELNEERDPHNVAAAVARLAVSWPVVLDPNYATWDAYHNAYWPAQYLIDKHGRIAATHIGEGSYDEIDAIIRALLAEP